MGRPSFEICHALQAALVACLMSCGTIAEGAPSSPPEVDSGEARALCAALALALKGLELAGTLSASANDQVNSGMQLLAECKMQPICEYSRERYRLEEWVTASRKQQTRASELEASMTEKRRVILEQIEARDRDTSAKMCSHFR